MRNPGVGVEVGGTLLPSDSPPPAPGSGPGEGEAAAPPRKREVSENVELPLSGVGPADTGGGGGGAALSRLQGFPVSCRTFPAVPRGAAAAIVSAPGGGRKFSSRAAGLSLPSWSLRERGPRDPAWLAKPLGMLAPGPSTHRRFVCGRCRKCRPGS